MPFPKFRNRDIYTPFSQTNWSLTPNSRNRVSFIPISQEYVGWFDDNATISKIQQPSEGVARFLTGRALRNFQDVAANLAATATYGGSNSNVRFTGKMFERNYPIYYTLGTPRAGNVYSNPGDGGKGIPYDLYVDYQPLSKPQGSNSCFTDTESDPSYGESFDGSNCVGIIAARQKVFKSGGGVLNIEARQCFGLVGDAINIGVNRQFNAGPGFLGGALATPSFTSNNFVPPKTLYIPIWGSTSNAIYSFGGSILHAMAWDAWPDPLTVFLPQYFAVMHFNPGAIGSTSDSIVYNNVDYEEEGAAVGTVVNENFTSNKSVNTSLRGLMVTDGIKYFKKTISVNNSSASIEVKGKGYIVNDEIYNETYKIGIKVTQVDSEGGITGYAFSQDELTEATLDGEDLPSGPFKSGNGIVVGFPSSSSDQTAFIKWESGIVTNKLKLFKGPKQRCRLTRLTDASNGSEGRLERTKITQLNLDDNSLDAPEPGEYEVFYFFHSDIAANPRSPGVDYQFHPMRHITLTIS